MTDVELGQQVFARFNYWMSRTFSKSYTMPEIAAAMRLSQIALVDGVGFSYRIGLDEDYSKMDTAMKNLVSRSGGKIPSKATMDAAMRDSAQDYTFIEAAKFVTVETVKVVAQKAQAVGEGVLTTFDFLTKIGPFVLIAGLGYIAYKRVTQIAGK